MDLKERVVEDQRCGAATFLDPVHPVALRTLFGKAPPAQMVLLGLFPEFKFLRFQKIVNNSPPAEAHAH